MKRATFVQCSKCVLMGLLILNLGGLIACQKSEDNLAKDGGVDGSGGNLPTWHEQSFKDWIENDQKYYVADIVHRLLLWQNNPRIETEPTKSLIERFIGPDQDAFRRRISNLKYTMVSKTCPASNHPESDASISSDGIVCMSYQGFKNIPVDSLGRKVIAMTFHEIAHLQGFDESDATKIQNLFDDGYYGMALNLVYNDYYQYTHETWNKVTEQLGTALKELTLGGNDSKARACNSIAISRDRGIDLGRHQHYLPFHISTEMNRNVIDPLLDLYVACLDFPARDFSDKLVAIVKAIIPIESKLREFESPHCSLKTCVGRTKSIVAESLDRWELLGDRSNNRPPLDKIDLDKLSCQVKDLTRQTLVPFNRKSTYSFEISDENSEYKAISNIGLFAFGTIAEVQLTHFGQAVEILGETAAFNTISTITGYLLPGKRDKLTVRFNLLKENLKKRQEPWAKEYVPDTTDGEFVSLSRFDPYVFPRKRLPAIERELEMTCEFTP